MNNFVNTRTVAAGTQSVLKGVSLSWVKIANAVPGYNGGTMQFELQISTTDKEQAQAWKSVMKNLNVTDEGAKFTLKRAAFQGRPKAEDADGAILSEDARKTIGNGSVGDISIPQTHPTCLLYTSPSPRDS